jgi:hypothetical protein
MGETQEIKRYNHLSDQDVADAGDIVKALEGLDDFTTLMILERIRGMKDMQTIMERKTA